MPRLLLFLALLPTLVFAKDTLDIYWIDVEGGASTLLVTPGGQTILMDAGWAGFDDRDPKRIADVLENQVGRKEIDYFITSHFHADHVGGMPDLAKLVTIKKFVDHGDSVEAKWDGKRGDRPRELFQSYLDVADGKRMTIKPGDKLPVDGVDFEFLVAASKFIDKPLTPVADNPMCADATKHELDDGENGKSVGFIVRMGKFEFLDLGDLSWNFELEAACPKNLFGQIDLYQVTHHGMSMSGAPAHIDAIRPLVAVMNNGPHKGGQAPTYHTLMATDSLADLWQIHQALNEPDSPNTAVDKIANFEDTAECKGHWIKASVKPDGSFTVTNSRNGYSKTYQSR